MPRYLTKEEYGIYGMLLLTTDSCETCNLIQTCSCWNERKKMNNHWESEHHSRFWMWSRHYTKWISPLEGRFSALLTCHTLIPTSYIHDLSYLLVSKTLLLPCQNDLTLAFVSSPGVALCISAITVSLSVENESCFPTRPPQGCGQCPQEPFWLLQAS